MCPSFYHYLNILLDGALGVWGEGGCITHPPSRATLPLRKGTATWKSSRQLGPHFHSRQEVPLYWEILEFLFISGMGGGGRGRGGFWRSAKSFYFPLCGAEAGLPTHFSWDGKVKYSWNSFSSTQNNNITVVLTVQYYSDRSQIHADSLYNSWFIPKNCVNSGMYCVV